MLSFAYDLKSVGPEVPEMHENPTANDKRMWNYCSADLVKNKNVLESNLWKPFTLLKT